MNAPPCAGPGCEKAARRERATYCSDRCKERARYLRDQRRTSGPLPIDIMRDEHGVDPEDRWLRNVTAYLAEIDIELALVVARREGRHVKVHGGVPVDVTADKSLPKVLPDTWKRRRPVLDNPESLARDLGVEELERAGYSIESSGFHDPLIYRIYAADRSAGSS